MGLLTWIVIGILILAVLGLGVGTFMSGVQQGAEEISSLPIIDEMQDAGSSFIEERAERSDAGR